MKYKKILKHSILLFLMLILIVILSVAGYFGHFYYKNVRPYKPIINDILANADAEHIHLPGNIKLMIQADLTCSQSQTEILDCDFSDNLNYRVTRSLPHQLMKTLDRHIVEAMIGKTLVRRFKDNDKYVLIAELTPFTNEQIGYNNFSQHYFNKPLSQLSLEESAEMVAISRAPTYYLRDTEKLGQRKNYLLGIINK